MEYNLDWNLVKTERSHTEGVYMLRQQQLVWNEAVFSPWTDYIRREAICLNFIFK